jgi:hypothetical protein
VEAIAEILARTGRPMTAGRDIEVSTAETSLGWPVVRAVSVPLPGRHPSNLAQTARSSRLPRSRTASWDRRHERAVTRRSGLKRSRRHPRPVSASRCSITDWFCELSPSETPDHD